jgi:hypothetical protein
MKKLEDQDIRLYCMICTTEIDLKRARHGSISTCSRKCAVELRRRRLAMREAVRCRLCNAPVTVEERKAFNAWRREKGEVILGRPRKPKTDPPPAQMVMANDLTIH